MKAAKLGQSPSSYHALLTFSFSLSSAGTPHHHRTSTLTTNSQLLVCGHPRSPNILTSLHIRPELLQPPSNSLPMKHNVDSLDVVALSSANP
jgi:hypothetical protein